jgi:hypothetical protein
MEITEVRIGFLRYLSCLLFKIVFRRPRVLLGAVVGLRVPGTLLIMMNGEPRKPEVQPLPWDDNEWLVAINPDFIYASQPNVMPCVITADGFWSEPRKRWVPHSQVASATRFETRRQGQAFIDGYLFELQEAPIPPAEPKPFPSDVGP